MGFAMHFSHCGYHGFCHVYPYGVLCVSGGTFLVTETALKNSVFLLFVFEKDPLLTCFELALITSESANLICAISSVVLIS